MKFFDFMYDNKSIHIDNFIEHVEKEIYFRDMHMFNDRVKNLITIKNNEILRDNF